MLCDLIKNIDKQGNHLYGGCGYERHRQRTHNAVIETIQKLLASTNK